MINFQKYYDNMYYIEIPDKINLGNRYFDYNINTQIVNDGNYEDNIVDRDIIHIKGNFDFHRTCLHEVNIADKHWGTEMIGTFRGCWGLENAVCGLNVVNMDSTYYDTNISEPVCGPNVINMCNSYGSCQSIINPICGPNVVNMDSTYYYCRNIITPVCGNNVVNFSGTYRQCDNLTTAVCGNNVRYMDKTYASCPNLTAAVCGPNVTIMGPSYSYGVEVGPYSYCNNLTTAVCGLNVTNMHWTYSGCNKLQQV